MRVVDLFCGMGGSSVGVQMAGHTVVGAADWWEHALTTYRLNHPNHPAQHLDLSDEVRTLEWIRELRPDAICASPPCQSYSTSGSGARSCDLVVSTVSVAIKLGVKLLVIENVIPFISSAAWAEARGALESAGYSVAICKLTASNLGVPQKRRRAFAVCVRGGSDAAARDLEKRALQLSKKPHTSIDTVFPELKDKTCYLVGCFKNAQVLHTDRPLPTIRTNCAHWPKRASYKPRAKDVDGIEDTHFFSVDQLKIIQGLGGYRFPHGMSKSMRGKQLGNSVVPVCMKWIFDQVSII